MFITFHVITVCDALKLWSFVYKLTLVFAYKISCLLFVLITYKISVINGSFFLDEFCDCSERHGRYFEP